jgi:cobalt-zinc-cadmium efflux system outer membrane protein
MHKASRSQHFARAVAACLLLVGVPAAAQPLAPAPRVPMPRESGPTPPLPRLMAGPQFTLQQATEVMRKSHPLLAVVRADIQAAGADALAVGLWQNPQLDATYLHSVTPHPNVDPALGMTSAGYTQFIESGGAPRARRHAAELTQQAVMADGEGALRLLSFEVERAAIALVAAATRVQVLKDANVELDRANAIVTARVKAGAAPQYDATRIGLAVAQARASLIEAGASLQAARGEMNVAIGPDADSLPGLPAIDLYAEVTTQSAEPLLEAARTQRPDLLAAQKRAEAASAQVQVARKSVQPGFGLRGGVQYGNSSGEVDFMVGVSLPLPINDHGQGTISAALARAESAGQFAHSIEVQAVQRVRAAHEELTHRKEAFAQYRDTGAAQTQGMVSEAEAGYRAGKLSVLELVDAYVAKREGRLRIVDLAENVRQAELRLRRAVYAGTSRTGD